MRRWLSWAVSRSRSGEGVVAMTTYSMFAPLPTQFLLEARHSAMPKLSYVLLAAVNTDIQAPEGLPTMRNGHVA